MHADEIGPSDSAGWIGTEKIPLNSIAASRVQPDAETTSVDDQPLDRATA